MKKNDDFLDDNSYSQNSLDDEIDSFSDLTKKESFIVSLFRFFKNVIKKESTEISPTVSYSRFNQFLEFLEPNSYEYENVTTAVSLCEEALKIARQRLILANRIKTIEENLLELECFLKLSNEESEELRGILDRFSSLIKERNVLMYQITGFDRNIGRMENLETDANSAITSMQEAEKMQRILKQDIGYLEGEKSQLEHERSLLEMGIKFVKRFALGCILLFGAVTIFLAYSIMIKESPIFLPTSILILMTIAICTLLYLFDKRMRFELRVNVLKQQRCVELLNKKNTVCVYYTNFLRFEYKKYKVRNTQMLRSDLKEFKNYKHISLRLDAIRKIMYETEKQVAKFLKDKNISFSKYTIEQFAKTVNVADKIDYSKELAKDKETIESSLVELDKKHLCIWEFLEESQRSDTTEDSVIDKMIQMYFDEVSNMLFVIDKEEMAV